MLRVCSTAKPHLATDNELVRNILLALPSLAKRQSSLRSSIPDALQRSRRAGERQVVLISGEPGIGKSRLTAAVLERLASEPHTRLRYSAAHRHRAVEYSKPGAVMAVSHALYTNNDAPVWFDRPKSKIPSKTEFVQCNRNMSDHAITNGLKLVLGLHADKHL